jgi:transposase
VSDEKEKPQRGRPLIFDLAALATQRGYDSIEHMLHDMYVTKVMSIEEVAEDLHVAYRTAKRWLKMYNIKLRPRGGAQNVKITFTDAMLEEVKRDGVTAVALRLGVDRTTVLYHLRRLPPEKQG